MASIEELRAMLDAARDDLSAAIMVADAVWEQSPPDADENDDEEHWSPRKVAEHVIGSEFYYAGRLASGLGQPEPQRPEFQFADPAEALAGLATAVATLSPIYATITAIDLAREAGSGTVEALWDFVAHHCDDHAQQIRAAT